MKAKTNLKLLMGSMLVGLAAVSTAGGTYAWWSLNTQVDTDGLDIESVAPTNLYVREVKTQELRENWADSVNFKYDRTGSSKALPAVGYSVKSLTNNTPANLVAGTKVQTVENPTTPVFYKFVQNEYDGSIGLNGSYTESSTGSGTAKRDVDSIRSMSGKSLQAAKTDNTDYFKGSVELALNSSETTNTGTITPKLQIVCKNANEKADDFITADFIKGVGATSGGEVYISKSYGAIHIGLLVTDEYNNSVGTKWFEYDVSDFAYDDSVTTTSGYSAWNLTSSVTITDSLKTIAQMEKDTKNPLKVETYVWFDGPDTDCYTAGLVQQGIANIKISYEASIN